LNQKVFLFMDRRYIRIFGQQLQKRPEISDRKASHYPQIYILINPASIIFGLCYGDQVKDNNSMVEIGRTDTTIQKQISNLLQKNSRFRVYHKKEPETIGSSEDDITNQIVQGNFEKWSNDVKLSKFFLKIRYPKY